MGEALARDEAHQHRLWLREKRTDFTCENGSGHVAVAAARDTGDANDGHNETEKQGHVGQLPAADAAKSCEEKNPTARRKSRCSLPCPPSGRRS
jgi:hypothetical protein